MTAALVDLFCRSFAVPPAAITLDIDDTCDPVHGRQQLSLFNAHYDRGRDAGCPAPPAQIRTCPLRHPHRHRQAQQCRSAGLARRCPRSHRRDAAEPARRTPSVELERRPPAGSGCIGRNPAWRFFIGNTPPPNSARNTPRSSADAYCTASLPSLVRVL